MRMTWVGKIPWRRERPPTPVFWPGEFHGLCSPRGPKESDTTEWLSHTTSPREKNMKKNAYVCMYHWVTLLYSSNYSVQFNHSVVFDCLWPHEVQHAGPPCSSPTPRVHPDSHPSSQWCHPAISSSVVPFSSSPQSLPASESFPMSQLFTWGGQSTAVITTTS